MNNKLPNCTVAPASLLKDPKKVGVWLQELFPRIFVCIHILYSSSVHTLIIQALCIYKQHRLKEDGKGVDAVTHSGVHLHLLSVCVYTISDDPRDGESVQMYTSCPPCTTSA